MFNFIRGFEKVALLKSDVELQPHQQRALKKLEKSKSLLLYHGMGSGKTLTSIAGTVGDRTNVVVPAALRTNYAKELRKFTKREKRNVLSYQKATKYGLPEAEALVIDEPQNLGNIETQRSRAMISEAEKFPKRILLTGTPIRNYPHELAPIARILAPESRIPVTPRDFDKMFLDERQVSPGLINRLRGMRPGLELRAKNLKYLEKVFQGKVDYHMPEKVDYPARTDIVREVEMSPEQQKYYNVVTNKANPYIALKVKHGMPLSKQESKDLNSFMTAARIVSNTTKPYGGKGSSPKIQSVVNDLEMQMKANKEHRGVIYSNYLEGGLGEVAQELNQRKIPFVAFTGGLTDKQRKEVLESYNSGKVKVLLVSGAGSEGLDLKKTRSVHLLEPHWNNSRLEQVIGRGVRFKSHEGLPKDEQHVTVFRYHSTLPKTWLQGIFNSKSHMSTDQYLHTLSRKKDTLNEEFLSVLRELGSEE